MDRLVRILFPIVVVVDIAAMALIFILGLAFAPSSRSSPWAVTAFLNVFPALLLGGTVLLFLRATSPIGRMVALLLAGAPLVVLIVGRMITSATLQANMGADGTMTYFRAGPLRGIAQAIERNDSATVAARLPEVKINARGFRGTTLLTHALRTLEDHPDGVGIVALLLQKGADPNLKGADESPLELATYVIRTAGARPVQLLLEAGANPNAKDGFGTPVWFGALGRGMGVEALTLMLEHGADLTATDQRGLSALFDAAQSPNWDAVLLLLQRGVDWRQGRNLSGETFKDMVASHRRVFGDSGGVVRVSEYLDRP